MSLCLNIKGCKLSEEEKVQSLVSELRVLETYTTEINNRISLLARAIMENRGALELIKTYPDKDITDILVTIGGGLFLKASAPPPEKFIVNIGAQIAYMPRCWQSVLRSCRALD